LLAIFVFLNEKIAYDTKTTGESLQQLHTVMYHSWFCEWPWWRVHICQTGGSSAPFCAHVVYAPWVKNNLLFILL